MLRVPRINVNLCKVVLGVGFSLIWGRVMYHIWPEPSYLTFVWFYLAVGGILLKWGFFEIIDRVNLKLRLRAVRKELDESSTRVREVSKGEHKEDGQR